VGRSGVLIGEYYHSMDSKSRLIVPAKFRSELGKSIVMTRGLEGCLFVFPEKEWQTVSEKLSSLPLMKKDARQFMRMFIGGAMEVDIDKSGRFVIPNPLAKYAKLEKECVIVGMQNRLEIWSEENWATYSEESFEKYEEIAEELIDFEIKL